MSVIITWTGIYIFNILGMEQKIVWKRMIGWRGNMEHDQTCLSKYGITVFQYMVQTRKIA